MLLDGSVLYNTSHLFGFLSAIDPFAIKSLRFYKDGFPTEYGGRLSSVVDIKLREGNYNKTESYVNVGLVTSSVGINGPIKKDKFSFLLSSRIAYPGLLTLPFKNSYEKDNSSAFVSYFMYDFVSKLSWKINDRHSLYLSGTLGKDFLLTGNKENNYRTDWNINWGNSVLAFRYNGEWNKALRLNVHANFNNYKYSSTLQGTELTSKYKSNIINQSSIQDVKIGAELNWSPTSDMTLSSGASYTTSSILPVIKFSDVGRDTSSSVGKASSNEFSIYQSLKLNFLNAIKMDIGYRYSQYHFKDEIFNFFQPRFLISFQPHHSKTDLYFSYSKMYQPVHLLLNPSNGYINEVWIAANKSLPPQQMNEMTLGYHMKQNWGDIRLALFNRNFRNLIELKDNIKLLKFFSKEWSDLFEKNGTGTSRGFEFNYMHHFYKFNLLSSYTYTASRRTFNNINKGNTFNSPVDRPHVVSINADYVKNEHSTLTIGLTYFSGLPVTLPEYHIGGVGGVFVYTSRYNSRLPSYKRVDIGYKRSYINARGLPKEWSFSIYNLFLNKNITQIIPAAYGIPTPGHPEINIGERPYFQGKSFLAFIPGINFYYKFR